MKSRSKRDVRVLFEGRPSWRGYILEFTIGLLFLVPPLLALLDILGERYKITSEEVLVERGILNKDRLVFPYKHITSVQVSQTLFQRLLGIGMIILDTKGTGWDVKARLKHVPRPMEIADEIRRLMRS